MLIGLKTYRFFVIKKQKKGKVNLVENVNKIWTEKFTSFLIKSNFESSRPIMDRRMREVDLQRFLELDNLIRLNKKNMHFLAYSHWNLFRLFGQPLTFENSLKNYYLPSYGFFF